MKITISKQFKNLIYPLNEQEYHLLEQNILNEGIRDPLVVWQNGKPNPILLDGHHRYSIIRRHKIKDYRVIKIKLSGVDDAKRWMVDNQLGKRNVSPEAISYLRGLRYKLEKKNHGGNRKSNHHNDDLKPTSEILAKKYKVNKITIQRDEKYTDAIDTICSKFDKREQQTIKNKILSRQTNLSKKDILDIVESGLGIRHIKQVISGDKELWQVKLEIEQRRKKRKKKPVRIILPKEIKMYHGDCIEVMNKMQTNTFYSAVLDPPYGWSLGKKTNNFTPSEIDRYGLIEQAYFVGDRSPALKAGLYDLSYEGGKKYQKWCSKWGKELFRVMRPGAHALVFCSTKMLHRLTVGMEECGWITKNILTWNFGTGFPTSVSVSQQIDKMNGSKGKVVCENPNRKNRLNWDKNDKNITAPNTPEAAQWEGWFNNIKNSFEPILLIQKPLSEKTIADNVLKWGTGALNIDGCRIGNNGATKAVNIKRGEGKRQYNEENSSLVEVQETGEGRFPSNVILNSESGGEFNRQAGLNVSQYFYCPKPSEKEKNMGCEDTGNTHPTVKPVSLLSYLVKLLNPPSGKVIDIFSGSGTVGMSCAMNNMQYCGIEIEKEYYQLARRRIMAAYRKQQGG